MKKLFLLITLIGILSATVIKDNSYFIGANLGKLKIDNYDKNMIGLKVGYYFYDPNIYKINNRISLETETKIHSKYHYDFYITTLKLDWIKNTSTFFAPFIGINVAYIYLYYKGNDFSTNAYGGDAGILFEIADRIRVEIEGVYQKAFQKQDLWDKPIKTLKGGVEISF